MIARSKPRIRLDKAAIMLIMASVMWTYRAASIDPSSEQGQEREPNGRDRGTCLDVLARRGASS